MWARATTTLRPPDRPSSSTAAARISAPASRSPVSRACAVAASSASAAAPAAFISTRGRMSLPLMNQPAAASNDASTPPHTTSVRPASARAGARTSSTPSPTSARLYRPALPPTRTDFQRPASALPVVRMAYSANRNGRTAATTARVTSPRPPSSSPAGGESAGRSASAVSGDVVRIMCAPPAGPNPPARAIHITTRHSAGVRDPGPGVPRSCRGAPDSTLRAVDPSQMIRAVAARPGAVRPMLAPR